ncbi:hypothetical protein LR013_05830 [candidate division NPL-UPA2 bacterium]|nr:hypothetical protein [candidate division NPL-UPA2 bacterium]
MNEVSRIIWREELRMGKENQLEVVEILRISELPGRAFAEVKTAEGKVQWEEISLGEARREKRRLKRYRVIKKRPRRDIAPTVRPVVRIGTNGVIGFGSNLVYKGIGLDGRPEYWHIPTATILVEDVGYAARQMAATLLMLKARRGLI